MSIKHKNIKLFLVLFLVVPALFFSVFLAINKYNIGVPKHYIRMSTYSVEGMTCLSCKDSVETLLKSSKNVLDASVDFDTETVLIKYNSRDIGFIGLSELLREDNYRLRILEKNKLKNLGSNVLR